MELKLRPGMTATERIRVERDRTITFMGEGAQVYSTPSMVSDVEYACLRLIQKYLDEAHSSVGIHVSIEHLAATPMGCEVEVEVKISEVDGRRIILDAEVRDAVEVVGRGQHQRYVIDVARRTWRIEEKRKLIESRV